MSLVCFVGNHQKTETNFLMNKKQFAAVILVLLAGAGLTWFVLRHVHPGVPRFSR